MASFDSDNLIKGIAELISKNINSEIGKSFLENESVVGAIRAVNDTAVCSDLTKNGRWYQFGDGSIFTKIYTNQIINLDPFDISLAPHLILEGCWEMELTLHAERIVQSKGEKCCIFDVGANFGWYGLILSRFSSESSIHFFEANPGLTGYIEKTVTVNGLLGRSSIVNKAVSEHSGQELVLDVPQFHKGSATLRGFQLINAYENPDELKKVAVSTISLDDYCAANGISEIHFLKIDTEGFEGNVLAGARQTIAASANLSMLVEWNMESYQDDVMDALRHFSSCQFLDKPSCNIVDITDVFRRASSVSSFESDLVKVAGYSATAFDLFFHK